MNRTENIWFQLAILHILFGCFCRGQVSLAPADVPWKNEPWTLVCSVDSIVATVSIVNPSGTTVGYCDPSDEFSPAICSPSVGFVINETADTVSMTRTIASSETGSWACQHSSKSGTYILSSPLPNRTLPDSSASYGMHSMSPVAGSEITTDTVHNFTYHYGCVSSGLKFVWTIMPDSSLEDTSSTMSNGFACTTNSAYMSTIDESATILQAITSTGKKLKVSVYVDGYSNLPIVEYTYDVTFAPGSSDGGNSGDDFWWIIVIVVVLILILIILFCCFFNKRCRFRYLCADSKCAFTLPKRVTYIIWDKNKSAKGLEGEDIEIQFLNRGKGTVRHDIGTKVGKTEKNPCILFNPYIVNKSFKKEHEGIYNYESKLNENRNCYSLKLLFQEDTIIADTSFVYWAHVGERLRLQFKDDNFSVHITKKSNKNENVTRIKSTSRTKGLVLNNICNADAGSYQVISTDKAKKSGCLTLKIVNDHIIIGNRSESYVATVGSSIKLQSMQCETLNIKSVTWKKSLHNTGRDSANADARDNKSCTSKYALVLSNVTKQHKGFYFCEIIYQDNQQKTETSAILKLDVVDDIVSVGMTPSTYIAMKSDSIEIRHNGASFYEYIKFPVREGESNRVKPLSKQIVSPLIFDKISKSDEGEYRFQRSNKSVLTLFVAELKEFGSKDDSHVTTKGNSIKLRFTGCKLSQIKRLTWKKSQKEKVIQRPYLNRTDMNELILSRMTTEDEGSYQCLMTLHDGYSIESPTLTLHVVDELIKVGEEAVFHVCLKNRSLILQYTGCLGQNIRNFEWRKPQNASEDDDDNFKKELILKNVKEHEQGEYLCEITYIDGYEIKRKRSGTVTLTTVDAIFNMDMESISCSATTGDSIQIRCTSDTVPQHIVFTVAVNGTNQVAPTPKKTKGSSLLIERISKEHEGCYYFQSDDDQVKSGVLTLSVNEVTNRSSAIHLRSEKPATFRPGAKKMLNSIGVMPDIEDGHTYKKERKINEDPESNETNIAEKTDEKEPEIIDGKDQKEKRKKRKKKKKEKGSDANAND